jgi:hypothetical protein
MTARRLTEHLRILTDSFPPVTRRFAFGPRGRYSIRVANDLESRRRAYNLVYQQYLEKEYARPHPSKMWLTLHNAVPDAVTLMVERGDEVVAALTAVPDSPLGLPADEHYKTELDQLRSSGHRLCELISLGVGSGNQEAQVLAKIFNAAYVHAYRVSGLTDFVITITPRHARFYRRLLCFENLGPIKVHSRYYDSFACMETEACLEHLPLSLPEELIRREHEGRGSAKRRNLYRMFENASSEEEMAEMIRKSVRPMTERELSYFFVEHSNLFAEASPEQMSCIADLYFPHGVLLCPPEPRRVIRDSQRLTGN